MLLFSYKPQTLIQSLLSFYIFFALGPIALHNCIVKIYRNYILSDIFYLLYVFVYPFGFKASLGFVCLFTFVFLFLCFCSADRQHSIFIFPFWLATICEPMLLVSPSKDARLLCLVWRDMCQPGVFKMSFWQLETKNTKQKIFQLIS